MMLATLDSLIDNDWQVDIEDMRERFNAWLHDANMPSMGRCSTAATPSGKRFVGAMDSTGNGTTATVR